MIYTLFIWTVVAHAYTNLPNQDWRALATVEARYLSEDNEKDMLAKCENVAKQLRIPKENYRCVRTK